MLQPITVPIHSFVDVITNSSTVIYVGTHGKTIEYAKDLINTILKAGESQFNADDLFTFSIIPDMEYLHDLAYDHHQEWCPTETWVAAKGWGARSKIIDEYLKKVLVGDLDKPDWWSTENYDGFEPSNLLLNYKRETAEAIDLGSKLQSIFSIESSYGG